MNRFLSAFVCHSSSLCSWLREKTTSLSMAKSSLSAFAFIHQPNQIFRDVESIIKYVFFAAISLDVSRVHWFLHTLLNTLRNCQRGIQNFVTCSTWRLFKYAFNVTQLLTHFFLRTLCWTVFVCLATF